MIEVYPIGESGITSGIDHLIKLIEEHKEQVVSVGKIHDGDDNYSYMALFRERGTIGQFVAFVHEWGVNDGRSGEGGRGFIRINEFLYNNSIDTKKLTLSKAEFKELNNQLNIEKRLQYWRKQAFYLLQKI